MTLKIEIGDGPFLSFEIEIGDGPGPELDNFQFSILRLTWPVKLELIRVPPNNCTR